MKVLENDIEDILSCYNDGDVYEYYVLKTKVFIDPFYDYFKPWDIMRRDVKEQVIKFNRFNMNNILIKDIKKLNT